MSALIIDLGVVLGAWGFVWYLWDHRARAPGKLILGSCICLVVGWYL